ncbi:MAG TPA: SH3 domain-containing protein, partial [Alphaproteobacteria bacterium]|nr:SH3 domain-containing protein [Alphaproteobacteria bacterium]
REAPEIRAKQVGRLKEGESVHVAGKVKGEEWYAVEPKGQALAYVAVAALEDAAAYQAQKEREQQAKAAEAAQRAAAATPAPAPAAAQGTELAKLPQAAEPGKAPAGAIRYVGHLACEKIPGLTNNTVLAEITILANGTRLDFSRPVYSFDGKQAVATESGTGTLAPDGTVKLEGQMQGSIGRFDSSYQGTLKGDQIELKGVENIPMGGKLFTRDCKASLARQ